MLDCAAKAMRDSLLCRLGDRLGTGGRYQIQRKLGSGQYSTCWLVSDEASPEPKHYACKILTANATKLVQAGILQELAIYERVRKGHKLEIFPSYGAGQVTFAQLIANTVLETTFIKRSPATVSSVSSPTFYPPASTTFVVHDRIEDCHCSRSNKLYWTALTAFVSCIARISCTLVCRLDHISTSPNSDC